MTSIDMIKQGNCTSPYSLQVYVECENRDIFALSSSSPCPQRSVFPSKSIEFFSLGFSAGFPWGSGLPLP
uniref:Uncharacterized protein n=1 Tax=Arundo donax TaxID=35708 RepID=A0A0A8ZXV2_ARUDO